MLVHHADRQLLISKAYQAVILLNKLHDSSVKLMEIQLSVTITVYTCKLSSKLTYQLCVTVYQSVVYMQCEVDPIYKSTQCTGY